MPTSSNMPKLLSFFNCAAALMTSKLQNLAIDSMSDYTHLISPDAVGESVKMPARQMHKQVDTFNCDFFLSCVAFRAGL